MAKRKVGKIKIDLPSGEEVALDKINDPKLSKMLSYLMNGYIAYSSLHRGPKLPKGARVQVYGTKIPIFGRTRKGAYHSGVTKPVGGEDYVILIDERLEEHEKLAVLAHELGHIAGGYKESDKESQKIAIQNLNNVLTGYEKLAGESARRVIKRDVGVDYNPQDIPREEVKDALQYLTQSGEVFDVGRQEWSEANLPHVSEHNRRKRRKGLEDYTSIILVLIGFFLMFGNNIGITGYSFFEKILSINNINIFGAIFLILGVLILLKKRLR